MQNVFKKISEKTGIPSSNILNGWQLLRESPPAGKDMFIGDNVHPSLDGYKVLAQEAYKMLSTN